MVLTEFQKTLTAYLRCLPFSDCRRFMGVLCPEARRFLAPLRADAKTGAVVVIAPPSMLLSEEGILAPLVSEGDIGARQSKEAEGSRILSLHSHPDCVKRDRKP